VARHNHSNMTLPFAMGGIIQAAGRLLIKTSICTGRSIGGKSKSMIKVKKVMKIWERDLLQMSVDRMQK
jgi:hypothetical protein